MEELLEKMASLLQEIYDEGHGGEFRGSINLLLVQYNAAQQAVAADVCQSCREPSKPIADMAGNLSCPNCGKRR